MLIKNIIEEDFVNYRVPSMFIAFPSCSFKCDKENGCSLCQNSRLAQEPNIGISATVVADRYIDNPISEAIVCGGLEPFDSAPDLLELVEIIRKWKSIRDDIVIYTGYTEEELQNNFYFQQITQYPNIIIKFGRFRPNEEKHFDEVLGVSLASSNQYAKRYN